MPIDIGGGNYITKIPALSEDADIQEALKLYHFGDGIEPEKSIVAHLSRIEAEAIGTRVLDINTLSGVGNNLDNIAQSGFYVQSTPGLASSGQNYPSVGGQRYPGILTVTNGSPSQVGSDIVYQEYNAASPSDLNINFKFIRRRFPDANNQPRWSQWKRLVSADDHNHDTLYYRREQLLAGSEQNNPFPLLYSKREIDEKFLTPEQVPQGVPTGAIMMWTDDDNSVPEGWTACNGNSYSTSDPLYEKLFDVIGYRYGSVSDGAQFRVPNLKGRIPVGVDNLDSDFNVFGKTGGAKTHTLTTAQMPSHNHTQNPHNHTQNAHTHGQNAHSHNANTSSTGGHNHSGNTGGGNHEHSGNTGGVGLGHSHTYRNLVTAGRTPGNFPTVISYAGNSNRDTGNALGSHAHSFSVGGGSHNHSISLGGGNHNHNISVGNTTAVNNSTTAVNNNTTATNNNTGGGQPHNNLQPYIVLNYIIKL